MRNAAATSLVASVPIALAGTAPPKNPSPLLIDGKPTVAPGGGFYADPYSGYATWYVDGATGVNTGNPGIDRRPAGYIYKNYENALIDVFYIGNPGARRIIVRAGVYGPLSMAVGGYFPAGGPDSAHPCVVQGDPSLAAPPVIDGNGSRAPAFGIGNLGQYNTGPVTVNNIVIRKLEIRNYQCDSVYFYWGPSSNVTVEYCNFHGNRYPPTNPGASGAIGVPSANCVNGLTVQNCKFSDFKTVAGGYQLNCVPIETYGCDNVTIRNCLFTGNYAAIRTKLKDGIGTANDWTIANNIFAGNYASIMEGTNGNFFFGPSNWIVSGNLFYGPALAGVGPPLGWDSQGYAATRGSNIAWVNNTFAEDTESDIGWIGATSVVVKDNLSLSARHFNSPDVTDAGETAQSAVAFVTIDNNVYGNGAKWNLGWGHNASAFKYQYATFAQWQSAFARPLAPTGSAVPLAPPELLTLAGLHNPDRHGLWIPNLPAPYNTIAGNFPNAAARDYTIAVGSPLLTASTTGGRVGYDPTNIGPGW
jgi:hypothetical protein